MRDYGKIAPQFWTGDTGKKIKASGPEAVVVALYLMTSPHANMIGLYYLPMIYLAHETGLGVEGASKGLARCIEADLCTYDEASEHVFVHAMARFQIADSLKPGDLRCKGVENELSKCPKGALQQAFRAMYAEAFHLKNGTEKEAPSKPLASQEQEQEQEQEKELSAELRPADVGIFDADQPPTDAPKRQKRVDNCPVAQIVALYHELLPMCPKVEKITKARAGYIRQRWLEDLPTLDAWRAYLTDVAASRFLTGYATPAAGKPPFVANLEWLTRPGNFAKVAEGTYHR